MLQAERRDGPRRVIREDVADPSLLGTGEHGAAIVAEQHRVGQLGLRLPAAGAASRGRLILFARIVRRRVGYHGLSILHLLSRRGDTANLLYVVTQSVRRTPAHLR